MAEDNFFSRWSRRKVQAKTGEPLPADPPAPAPVVARAPAAAAVAPAQPAAVAAPAVSEAPPAAAPPEPPPSLDDALRLTPQDDFRRFVASDVSPEVRNAAVKKLFADPHFNVMDGLDIYIDDYGQPDPLPAGMLRKMVQSQALRLFADEERAPARPAEALSTEAAAALPAAAAEAAPLNPAAPDEDTAVQLQPDDGAGRPGAEPGPGEDAGRQH